MLFNIILFVISIAILIYGVYLIKHTHKINNDIDNKNQELQNKLYQINEEVNNRQNSLEIINNEINNKNTTLESYKTQLEDIQSNISKTLDNQKELSEKAYENYIDLLEKQYEESNQEYEAYMSNMREAYSQLQMKLMREADACREDLTKIQETRAAAIQAITREKEIAEKLSFYCLQVSDADLNDIKLIETIKPRLTNKRVIDMLIWQSFFQKPMGTLCANVIGTETTSGIYKITNQKTQQCYIGQAVDLASRWKQHCKCALGIDTPAGNKLYKAMQEYGVWNFSWEVLEKCSSDQLNEKEKYYISLYDSKNYGYNSNAGVGK